MNLTKKIYLIPLIEYKKLIIIIFLLIISCSKKPIKVKLEDGCKFIDDKKETLICDEKAMFKITKKDDPRVFTKCEKILYNLNKQNSKYENLIYKCEYSGKNIILMFDYK